MCYNVEPSSRFSFHTPFKETAPLIEMHVGIIGVGVVGGATGKVLETKHDVTYYDRYKPGFQEEIRLEKIAREAEIAFICVSTPMKPSGEMDYSAIYHSLEQLSAAVSNVDRNLREIIVVIRSTAVSGTTDNVAREFFFEFAFNPEFLREKYAEEDMLKTSRVVIGANQPFVHGKIERMYREVFPNATYTFVDIKTAEMIKYAANVILASQIAVANEIYKICKGVGVDYDDVRKTILQDERIGRNIEVPGPDGERGFGGKCFPKDLRALIYLAREHNVEPYLLDEVWRSNLSVRTKKDWLDIKGATSQNNFS